VVIRGNRGRCSITGTSSSCTITACCYSGASLPLAPFRASYLGQDRENKSRTPLSAANKARNDELPSNVHLSGRGVWQWLPVGRDDERARPNVQEDDGNWWVYGIHPGGMAHFGASANGGVC